MTSRKVQQNLQCQMLQRRGEEKMEESRGALGIHQLGSYWFPQREVFQAGCGDKDMEAETLSQGFLIRCQGTMPWTGLGCGPSLTPQPEPQSRLPQWQAASSAFPCVPYTFHFLFDCNLEDVGLPFKNIGCGMKGEGKSCRLWKVYLGYQSETCRSSRAGWKVNRGEGKKKRR